jgi:hypothetical protein
VKRFFALILLVACLLPACSSVLPRYAYTRHPYNTEHTRIIEVWVDKDFSEPDKILVDNSLRAWTFALNGYIEFQIVSTSFDLEPSDIKRIQESGGIAIMKIDSKSGLIPSPDDGEGTVLAFTINRHWIYMIRDRQTTDRMFQQVLMHEEGHTLRSAHIKSIHHSLMNPNYSDAYCQCIDYWTILLVSQAQGLDITKLNYCVYEGEYDN